MLEILRLVVELVNKNHKYQNKVEPLVNNVDNDHIQLKIKKINSILKLIIINILVWLSISPNSIIQSTYMPYISYLRPKIHISHIPISMVSYPI